MAVKDRRNHIALSPRKGRKKPKPPPPYLLYKDDDEEDEKIEYQSDIQELQYKISTILSSSQERNNKIQIIEENLYFILSFFGKISWSVNRNLIRALPVEIKEIINDNALKVSLKKHSSSLRYNRILKVEPNNQ